LLANTGEEMKKQMKLILQDKTIAGSLADHALKTIQKKHTCLHRAKEFIKIAEKTRHVKKLIA
jgi:spore maturation protein CgeB